MAFVVPLLCYVLGHVRKERNSYTILIRKWKETDNLEDADLDINVLLK
jgi:hypothetical protein